MHNFIVNNYKQISDFLNQENIVIRISEYDEDFNVKFYIEDSSVKIILLINNKKVLTRIIFLREDIQQMLTFDANV